MQKDPIKTNRVSHLLKSIYTQSMHNWEDGGETEADKHAGSKWSPRRGAEFWVHRDDSTADSDCSDLCSNIQKRHVKALRVIQTYHTPVESLQHWLAVEAIVYARDKASGYQNDDAQVIDLIAPSIDL